LAAQTKARAIPVLPLVGSTIVVSPGRMRPSCSAASIIAAPIRSFTEAIGLSDSSFTTISAEPSLGIRLSLTSGVLPIISVMLDAMPLNRTALPFLTRLPQKSSASIGIYRHLSASIDWACYLVPNIYSFCQPASRFFYQYCRARAAPTSSFFFQYMLAPIDTIANF
jgi:hypothetical protein